MRGPILCWSTAASLQTPCFRPPAALHMFWLASSLADGGLGRAQARGGGIRREVGGISVQGRKVLHCVTAAHECETATVICMVAPVIGATYMAQGAPKTPRDIFVLFLCHRVAFVDIVGSRWFTCDLPCLWLWMFLVDTCCTVFDTSFVFPFSLFVPPNRNLRKRTDLPAANYKSVNRRGQKATQEFSAAFLLCVWHGTLFRCVRC